MLADVSGILIIKKAINHGDTRRYVSYLVDGKRSQRFFRTKEDAQNWKGRLRFKTADSALPPSQVATDFPGHPSP